MDASDAKQVRALAAEFRSRAEWADPQIARILAEIAGDLEAEAQQLDRKADKL